MTQDALLTAATRDTTLAAARAHFDSGAFLRDLARRVAIRTESQNPASGPELQRYLADEIAPSLAALGFNSTIHPNPEPPYGPLLIGCRVEDPALPTVLMYGHGDVIRGQDASWTCGQGPWTVAPDGDRLYGRGTADNKGQHSINIAALAQVLAQRGRLGFNVTWLIETGEETGSPGLAAFCAAQRDALAADVLIASDGPRLSRDRATVFLGSRGVANFELSLTLRDGGHHSGNWGGLLRNPGTVLANAIACLVDGHGVIRVPALRPPPIQANVRRALEGLHFGSDPGDPVVDPTWGEPGLTPAERVIAWNTLEVLAYKTGNPDFPVNAIPPSAKATMHMRFVVGTDTSNLQQVVKQHLAAHGFADVEVGEAVVMHATRLDPDNAWCASR
jgi:acetylornithine deacetylase/succinyl-diaminopimelate desuccinylase-like protein